MKDIFISPTGNMLDNWSSACPKAEVVDSLRTVSNKEPALFWIHANANHAAWLEKVLSEIERKFQTSKVVVLANTPSQTDALTVIKRGAVGYCHAYSAASVLKELKTVVLHGGIWLGNDLLQTLISATKTLVHSPSEKVEKALALLTDREKQVALEAAKGLSNKEIARVFNITERTVKAHISKSLEKLGVKDRLQLALVLNDKTGQLKSPARKTRKAKLKSSAKSKQSPVKRTSITNSDKKVEQVSRS